MEKGDKVKVLPNKKYGVVDRIEEGFIFLVGDHRPYMRGQLAYADAIITGGVGITPLKEAIMIELNEMNKHEEIRLYLKGCKSGLPFVIPSIEKYSHEAEATEKELEELQRDVDRYFELENSKFWVEDKFGNTVWGFKDKNDGEEHRQLSIKLSKVGKEE